jgi:hypothetical protein
MEIPSNGSTNGAEFVSGLMQRLKSGEISKMQLFQQLATLQPGSPAPIPSPPTHASAFSSAPPSLPDQAGMTNQPSFSTPFSVLRQASSSGLSGNGNYNREDFSNAYGQSLSRQSSNYVPVSEVRDTDFLDGGISHEKAQRLSVQEWMANKNTTSSHQSITSMAHSSSNSPTHRGSVASQVNTILRDHYTPRGSLFFQNQESSDVVSSAYTNHYQQQYEVYQQQQEQLNHPVHHPRELMIEEYDSKNGVQNSRVENFTPTNGDPNGNENKFHERVARWKSQKEIMREQMKQQMLQEELSECTFHPRINPKSNKVAAKLRGKNTNQNVTERLYQEADNYKAREELAAKLKAEEVSMNNIYRHDKLNQMNPIYVSIYLSIYQS